ncbi:MAG: ectoine hydroxylase-related dioxygenase (phytanoyl-CoA dioxygenase family) [Candidatus Latescibacterota bacterium]|jgi:ectoine hydroxylase-related dioxygenase (phytanoyl-CoA dioxygenase family)
MSEMPEPTIRLTEEQIAFYHGQGYLAIDQITTMAEVERLRQAYDRIFEQRAGHDEGDEFDLVGAGMEGAPPKLPQIIEPRNYASEFRNTLYEANAAAIADQLLGEGVVQRGSHAIFKPAHYGSHTPWHQDEAYWNPGKNYHSVSIWMPLQEATLENGCMQFMPRAHKLEVLPHHKIGHDPKVIGLEVDEGYVDISKAVACPMSAGGATFHGGRMLHYAGSNRTEVPRRAYILMLGVPVPPPETPRDFYWKS